MGAPEESQEGRAELPQFGDECLLFGGCDATARVWQEAGQGLGSLTLGLGVCGAQRVAAGRSTPGPQKLPWWVDGGVLITMLRA